MVQSVAQVADAMGLDESRVRAMLRSGRLKGRKLGGVWVIDSAAASRAARERAPGGRPLAPARAWGVLHLLDGGGAPWLDAVGRSRARALVRGFAGADANRWRGALRARQLKVECRVHPAALGRLTDAPGVVAVGPAVAARAGADLVALRAVEEVYVRAEEWPQLVRRLGVKQGVDEPNLVVRLPAAVWPFEHYPHGRPGLAVLAADLLDSPEPRAIEAGVAALNELAARVPAAKAVH